MPLEVSDIIAHLCHLLALNGHAPTGDRTPTWRRWALLPRAKSLDFAEIAIGTTRVLLRVAILSAKFEDDSQEFREDFIRVAKKLEHLRCDL